MGNITMTNRSTITFYGKSTDIYKGTLTNEQLIIAYGYEIHKINKGWFVVDPLDDKEGFSLFDDNRERLLKDTVNDLNLHDCKLGI